MFSNLDLVGPKYLSPHNKKKYIFRRDKDIILLGEATKKEIISPKKEVGQRIEERATRPVS